MYPAWVLSLLIEAHAKSTASIKLDDMQNDFFFRLPEMQDPLKPDTDETGRQPRSREHLSSQDTEFFLRRSFDEDPQKGCELLFRMYYAALCSHAVRFVYSKEVAEDLVADTFYNFWKTRAFDSVKQSYRAYLLQSVRNRAYNYLANELKSSDSLESIPYKESHFSDQPERIIHFDELQNHLQELIQRLPTQCRKVFILNRFEGVSNPHIARLMNISVRTVETHISNALGKLREGLKDHWILVWALFLTEIAMRFP